MKKSLAGLVLTTLTISLITPTFGMETSNQAEVMNPQEIDGTILVGGSEISVDKNITQNLIGPDVFTTLVTAVVEADLDEALMKEGPFTVFAPYNTAFDKISSQDLDALLADKQKLSEVLTYHVVAGTYSAVDLKDGLELTTLNGERLTFSYYNDNWYVNNAVIDMANMYSSNGVIHAIDRVLMPEPNAATRAQMSIDIRNSLDDKYEVRVQNVVKKYIAITKKYNTHKQAKLEKRFNFLLNMAIDKAMKTPNNSNKVAMLQLLKIELKDSKQNTMRSMDIIENAMVGDEYVTFLTALKAAGLTDALKGEGPFTVFVPTNAAFDKLPSGDLEKLLLESNKQTLQDILKYHVVDGLYLAGDIEDGTQLTTLTGEKITFNIELGSVMINQTSMLQNTDMVTSNGVIHTIDTIVAPTK